MRDSGVETGTKGPPTGRTGWWRAALVLGVLLAFVAWSFNRLDWPRVLSTLEGTNLPLFCAFVALLLAVQAVRAERWRILVPGARLPRPSLYFYMLVGYGLSVVMPAGTQETLRVFLLKRRHQVPVATGISGMVLEKFFEGVGLVPLVAPLPWLLDLPEPMGMVVLALASGGLAATVAMVGLAHASSRHAWRVFRSPHWRRIAPSLESLRDPGTMLRLSLLSVAAQAIDCACLWLMLQATSIDVPVATTGLLILMLSLAQVIPLVPGQLLTLEAGAISALAMVGVDLERALAFALVCHAAHLVCVVFALPGVTLLGQARADLRADSPA